MSDNKKVSDFIEEMKPQHRENLSEFFADMGSAKSLKNNEYYPLQQANEYTRKAAPRRGITKDDVYAALGFNNNILTNPADRKLIQPLVDLVFENVINEREPYDGFVGSELYQSIKTRANENGLGITTYMEKLGFPWEGHNWSRAKLLREIFKRANTNDGSIDFDGLPEKIQSRLRSAAKEDGTQPQNLVMENSNGLFHLAGEHRFAAENEEQAIAIIQNTFDKLLGGGVELDASILRDSGLYDWMRNLREAMGFAMDMSIEEFINTKLTGYNYTGQDTIQNRDGSVDNLTIKTTADVIEKT